MSHTDTNTVYTDKIDITQTATGEGSTTQDLTQKSLTLMDGDEENVKEIDSKSALK